MTTALILAGLKYGPSIVAAVGWLFTHRKVSKVHDIVTGKKP